MKKANYFFLLTVLCAALAIPSCKKKGDPGPAGSNGTNGINGTNGSNGANGTNGTNGTPLPYKETGTNITVAGNYASDNASFNNPFSLSYYASLSENAFVATAPVLRQADTRTSATGNTFYITRRDSLNNCVLTFEIYDDGSSNPQVNEMYFDLHSDITSTGYRRVFTYGDGSLGNGGGGVVERTSNGPNDYAESMNSSDFTSGSNAIAITNWNFNSTTGVLTFNYNGTLDPNYNSTGNTLTFSGAVKASTKQESLRTAAQ